MFGSEIIKSEVKLADKPDWPELEKLKLEAEVIGFYLSAHPLDSFKNGMEKLGVKNCAEVMRGIQVGDTIKAKVAGCVTNFQKRLSKTGNKYAFLEVSDASSTLEGILFSESLAKFEDVITSGLPLLLSVTIDKQNEEGNPRVMINFIKTLDNAISESANAT